MFMDAEGCLVTANSDQVIDKIISLWGYEYEKDDACCFEVYPSDVFEVMEKVVKIVHHMEVTGEKEEFSISGKIPSDWDCTIFTIVYDGNEPLIKSAQAEPDEIYISISDRKLSTVSERKPSRLIFTIKGSASSGLLIETPGISLSLFTKPSRNAVTFSRLLFTFISFTAP